MDSPPRVLLICTAEILLVASREILQCSIYLLHTRARTYAAEDRESATGSLRLRKIERKRKPRVGNLLTVKGFGFTCGTHDPTFEKKSRATTNK